MKPGQIVLATLAQADGRVKPRPALILREWAPFPDILVCGISTQLRRFIPDLDEFIRPADADFPSSGLLRDSVIRLGFLGSIPISDVRGYVGQISAGRLTRLLRRLSSVLQPPRASLHRILGIIPARYASTRFPGKPLHLLAGKPLVQHVIERCRLAKSLAEVIVATDDSRIARAAEKFCRVEMTLPAHPSGTDRIAEVLARVGGDAAVNVQGDEPLMDPAVIDAVAGALADAEMSTAATALRDSAEYDNPNVVKVVVSAAGRALYFSRRTIPYLRDAASLPVGEQLAAFPFLKHLGIYGYRRETLLRLVKFPVSPLEQAERLEQLRALENGVPMAVVRVNYDSVGVDTPADANRVEQLLKS